MVVHAPGEWFDDVLDGLARQDYGNLKVLFLVVDGLDDTAARIAGRVPNSFVRAIDGNPGFGAAANEVLRLVEGENGFFCFLHDDVVLDDTAIRLLVEELYRSNAGIVGPKLVDWHEPAVLQHVGLGVDRFGEVDPLVEPGEFDQEQHDAVRDVFAVPSACLLVRADLFRAVGGFDPLIEGKGDDIDLCWRAHLSGARVVVVPGARARHLEQFAARVPELVSPARDARDRMRTVATLTGPQRLPLVLLQLLLLSVAQALYLAVRGRFREAGGLLSASLGMLPRLPSYFARRRTVAPLRQVPYTEVAGLQLRGSARVAASLRARDSRPFDPEQGNERRWRESAGSVPVLAWLALLVLFAVGSRRLITGGIPGFGEFLPFDRSPARMLGDFLSGWSSHGLGSSSPVPTAIGLAAVASVFTLFHMGLLHTLAVLGLVLGGYVGAWRLATLFPSARARIALLVVYAAVPLPSQLLSAGRWGALACYAAAPWLVHLVRRLAGVDTHGVDESGIDSVVHLSKARQRRLGAQLVLLVTVLLAFVPAAVVMVIGIGAALALATVLVGGRIAVAGRMLGTSLMAVVLGFVLNLPWSWSLIGRGGWTALVGVPPNGATARGVSALARMDLGSIRFGGIALCLFLPVLAAPLVARSWRFGWAVRAAALVVSFGALAVLDDQGVLPVRLPEAGVLLVPVALGVALAAACIAAAFDADVMGGHFGWRQPLGVFSVVAAIIGVVPGVLAVADGRWGMPKSTLQKAAVELPVDPASGDYRILWLGDPSAIPVTPWAFRPGIGYAITDDDGLRYDGRFPGLPGEIEQQVADALDQMASGLTLRGGRLLAQYGIRYVIVPVADGFNGTIDQPLPAPDGLVDVLDDQLDMSSPLTAPPNYLVYENTAATPTRGVLTALGADASTQAGGEAVAQSDLRGTTPFAVGAPDRGPARGDLPAGTLHVAVPYDPAWRLTVGGEAVQGRTAFGATTAFDVPAAGPAVLEYRTSPLRPLLVALQALALVALALVATGVRAPRLVRRRRSSGVVDTSVVADLGPMAAAASTSDPAPGSEVSPDSASAMAEEPVLEESAAAAFSDDPFEIVDDSVTHHDDSLALDLEPAFGADGAADGSSDAGDSGDSGGDGE
jgi:GT2 family glycosyltransferase